MGPIVVLYVRIYVDFKQYSNLNLWPEEQCSSLLCILNTFIAKMLLTITVLLPTVEIMKH